MVRPHFSSPNILTHILHAIATSWCMWRAGARNSPRRWQTQYWTRSTEMIVSFLTLCRTSAQGFFFGENGFQRQVFQNECVLCQNESRKLLTHPRAFNLTMDISTIRLETRAENAIFCKKKHKKTQNSDVGYLSLIHI